MTEPHIHISASPHIHSKKSRSVQTIMLYVIIALLPTTIWGIISFGYKAAIVIVTAMLASVLTEFLIDKFLKHNTESIKDLSAVVTGLLIALNLSSEVPLYVPIIASIFAIAVCKMAFGGLGNNFANPAIGGRLFVMFSFASAMTRYATPRFLLSESVIYPTVSAATSAATSMATSAATSVATSAATSMATSAATSAATSMATSAATSVVTSAATGVVTSATSAATAVVEGANVLLSGATPLSYIKSAGAGMGALETLESAGYPFTAFAEKVGSALHINPYYVDAFFGNIGGSIGEVSAFLLIIGAVFLLCKKVISYHIPVSYLASFMLLTWVTGGNPIYGVLTGGIMLACLFMATDMVTTPITHKGEIIFGIGCGFLTYFFRSFASLPEGASIAILMMNVATPLIDKYTHPRVMGHKKGGAK